MVGSMTTEPDVEIPEYCGLTEDELAERRPRVEAMLDRVEAVEETERGWRFTFPGDAETLELVTTFAANERVCCPMADFELSFSGAGDPITFTMEAPDDMEADMKADIREGLRVDGCIADAS